MCWAQGEDGGGKMSGSEGATAIFLSDTPKQNCKRSICSQVHQFAGGACSYFLDQVNGGESFERPTRNGNWTVIECLFDVLDAG